MTVTLIAPAAVPLPHLGRCPECPDEIRIRSNGRLYAHGCTGDGAVPLLALKPTFARWLWAQSKRRDERTNRLTLFAARQYRGCTRAPKRHAGDMSWSSADELHGHLHLLRLAHGGDHGCDHGCDFTCRDLERAAAVYQQLAAAVDGDAAAKEEPGPVVRIFRRDAGWLRPDYADFADCTSNFHRQQDGRPKCTEVAVWKVVEDHGMHLSIGFYCDTDLPAEHRPAA